MFQAFSWSRTFLKMGMFFLIFAFAGLFFGRVAEFIAVAALVLLANVYWKLNKLDSWLSNSKKITPPASDGLLGHIYDGIYHMQRKDRKKRKKLGKMVKRFREGAEALPDATVVLDSKGVILWCNKLARIELGLRWPQDAGRRIDNLIRHPKFITFFQSGNFKNSVELPSPTNVQKIFEYRMMPNGVENILLIARDVTGIIQVEQMRRNFVANVSHELRTPLTVINGYLEMLIQGDDYPQKLANKALVDMSAQSSRMQTLIEELLQLSRIEANSENVFEYVVDVPQLLRAIESEASRLNGDKKHRIHFNIDSSLSVYGSETELRSAFSNLIFNAIHYTPVQGEITVSWILFRGDAKFSVVDNGEGIPEQHLSHLTERFYRVDKARARQTGGSGLGLAIVKHVLAHHHSKLMITSKLNVGSEFSFVLSKELLATKPQLKSLTDS